MRISTGMMFDAGVGAITKQSAALLKLQQQAATGKRILTPADDPVGASRAIETSQAESLTTQYLANQTHVTNALGIAENQLQGAGDILLRIRELTVQAGNTVLTDHDRAAIATELRGSFEQLLGVANTTDGSGQYIFSGYKGNVRPFNGSATSGVTYAGDDGQRRLQISASQQVAISDSGNDVFNRIKSGNGVFATGYASANSGSGVIDSGSTIDPAKWATTSNSGNLEVRFWIDTTGSIGQVNATYYDLVDVDVNPPASLFTGTDSNAGGIGNTFTHAYTSGQAIDFSGLAAPYTDFGATVTVTGTPASGDSFSVRDSTAQSVFETVQNVIAALERPVTSSNGNLTRLTNDIGFALTNLDQSAQNIETIRAGVGSRMNENDAAKDLNDGLELQYQQVLSQLQDVDFTKVITDMTRTQTQLEAAQKSFLNISKLSLFDLLT